MKISTSSGMLVGASKDTAHQGWIDLRSFQYVEGNANPPAAAAPTTSKFGLAVKQPGSNGATSFAGSITVTKMPDVSSVPLQQAAAKGQIFPQVVIETYQNGALSKRLTLSNVLIVSCQASPVEHQENVKLNFSKIE